MTAFVWELLGAVNVALLIRAYRPTFCRLLWLEFGPKSPGAACHPDGSERAELRAHTFVAAIGSGALLGADPRQGAATPPVPLAPHSPAGQAPNVGAQR